MQRIIFLDIDGPIINTPCYWVNWEASLKRTVMNTQSIGIVNKLAALANAKVVTNSTHNNVTVKDTGRSLKQDLIHHGMHEGIFHANWKTSMPWPMGRLSASSKSRRMWGIEEWIEDNGNADWICFDDEPFTDNKRLFVIDFDRGIDYDTYLGVLKFWELKSSLV